MLDAHASSKFNTPYPVVCINLSSLKQKTNVKNRKGTVVIRRAKLNVLILGNSFNFVKIIDFYSRSLYIFLIFFGIYINLEKYWEKPKNAQIISRKTEKVK